MDEVTRRQLTAEGFGDHEIARMVRKGQLTKLRRGVYLQKPPGEQLSLDERYRASVRAVLLVRGDDVLASHTSAAALLGLPVRQAATGVIRLTAPDEVRGRARGGVRVACAPVMEDEKTQVDGLWCTTPARTLIDLARTEPAGWALAALDHAMRTGLVSRVELAEAAERMRGVRGMPAARRVLARADARSGSVGESLSRNLFIEAGLAPDDLQRQLRYEGCLDVVDFWWDPRLAGEFDGRLKYRIDNPSGRSAEEVLWAEKVREDRLRRQGVLFVRWTWDDVLRRPDEVLGRVRQGLLDVRGRTA